MQIGVTIEEARFISSILWVFAARENAVVQPAKNEFETAQNSASDFGSRRIAPRTLTQRSKLLVSLLIE